MSESLSHPNSIDGFESAATDYRNNGQVEKAVVSYQKAYDLAMEAGDVAKAAGMMHMIGVSYKVGNQTQSSLETLDRAASLYNQIDDIVGRGRVLRDVAITHAYAGDLEQSESGLKASIEALTGTEAVDELAISEVKLGDTYLKKGDRVQAEVWMERGWDKLKDGDNWFYKLTTLGHMAELAFIADNYTRTDELTDRAIDILIDEGQQDGQKRRLAQLYGLRTISAQRQGRSYEADLVETWKYLRELDSDSRDYLLNQTGLKNLPS